MRDLIADKVAGARTQTEMRKFLARLRAQAIIEWKNDELKKAYEKQIAAEPRRAAASSAQSSSRTMHDAPAWYAVWTRSRHEQVVREQLERKGLEAFLPTITRWSRWKDRKKQVDWPLFPGYCFVRFNGAERLPVLKCTGVVNIVSFDGDIVADSRARDRKHPAARRERPPVRSVPADS